MHAICEQFPEYQIDKTFFACIENSDWSLAFDAYEIEVKIFDFKNDKFCRYFKKRYSLRENDLNYTSAYFTSELAEQCRKTNIMLQKRMSTGKRTQKFLAKCAAMGIAWPLWYTHRKHERNMLALTLSALLPAIDFLYAKIDLSDYHTYTHSGYRID